MNIPLFPLVVPAQLCPCVGCAQRDTTAHTDWTHGGDWGITSNGNTAKVNCRFSNLHIRCYGND